MISLPSGPFSFSSVTSISEVKPPTSVNCAMVVPSISIAKLRAAIASLFETFGTPAAIYPSLFAERCAARELGDLEDDELRGFDRGDPDLDDELARVDRLRGVHLAVALDVERFAGRGSEERAVAPDADQEGADGALDPFPERHVVGLEDHPLGAQQDGTLDVVEEPADVDVPPRRIAGEGARAPDPDAATGEGANDVDPLRVQPGRGIENGDPVAHQFAVGDHGQLYGLDLVGVDHAALVRGHQVGDAEHRDGVDGFETGKSGAVGRVAHVLVRGDPGGHRGPAALKRTLARGGDLLQCAGGPDLLELD